AVTNPFGAREQRRAHDTLFVCEQNQKRRDVRAGWTVTRAARPRQAIREALTSKFRSSRLRLRAEDELRERIVRVGLLRRSGRLDGPVHCTALQPWRGEVEPTIHVRRIDGHSFLKDVFGFPSSSLFHVDGPEVAVRPFEVGELRNAILKCPNGARLISPGQLIVAANVHLDGDVWHAVAGDICAQIDRRLFPDPFGIRLDTSGECVSRLLGPSGRFVLLSEIEILGGGQALWHDICRLGCRTLQAEWEQGAEERGENPAAGSQPTRSLPPIPEGHDNLRAPDAESARASADSLTRGDDRDRSALSARRGRSRGRDRATPNGRGWRRSGSCRTRSRASG